MNNLQNFLYNINDPLNEREVLSVNDELTLMFNNQDPDFLNRLVPKHIAVGTLDIVAISNDPLNPTVVTGLSEFGNSMGLEVDEPLGSIKNISGIPIGKLVGSFSMQVFALSGGSQELLVYSEKSLDGINWSANLSSLRRFEITRANENFITSISLTSDFLPDEYLRFVLYSPNDVELRPTQATLRGQVVQGASFAWELHT